MNNKIFANQQSEVSEWLEKISKSEKIYSDYHKLFDDIRKYYRNETRRDKQNIFWSSVETLKPFLYFKQPKPYIERKEKSDNKAHNFACRILEKALFNSLEHFDFDSIIKYARNDFLIGGSGIIIERYVPKFADIIDDDGSRFEIKVDENVISEYVNPTNFICDTDKVETWENCSWFAIRQYMSFDEVIAEFGENFRDLLFDYSIKNTKSIEVSEIWDKKSSSVMYITKALPHSFLKVISKNNLSDNFFPIPKPLFATTTNDSIIPIPDYVQIKPLLDELDGVTSRMEKTMKALKISGCYDNAFPELANILNKDITLVGVSDFDRLKSAGGIKNIVDFMPIEQYVTALQTLATRRKEIVEAIYEITGVSDIMRGTSNFNETATAVNKKTNFGTLRNQDRQNDMNRFISELFKIKAEYICEYFDSEKLLSFLSQDERILPEAQHAVSILKNDKLRDMVLGIESDLTFNEADKKAQNIEAVTSIHTMIAQAFDVVSKQPALLDLYRQMILSIVACLSNARQYEGILGQCFDKIAQEFSTPDIPKTPYPDTQLLAIQMQSRRDMWDYEIKKEQNEIKKNEFLLKKQQNESKNKLAQNEFNLQVLEAANKNQK